MELNLVRPIVFFDLETTGTDVQTDRIVEISTIKIYPGGKEPEEKCCRINPQRHIPSSASDIHHITDEDVADKPTFAQISKSLLDFFSDCDIAGFNSNKFDIPLLINEFARCGLKFSLNGRRLIDVQTIYHKMEKRTLEAAYKYYCQKDLKEAHSALADTRATYEVLKQQLEFYPELKNDIEFLSDFSRFGNGIDLASRFVRNADGEAEFNFGKHKGKLVKDIMQKEPGYKNWMLQGDFPQNTKDTLLKIIMEIESSNQRKN